MQYSTVNVFSRSLVTKQRNYEIFQFLPVVLQKSSFSPVAGSIQACLCSKMFLYLENRLSEYTELAAVGNNFFASLAR